MGMGEELSEQERIVHLKEKIREAKANERWAAISIVFGVVCIFLSILSLSSNWNLFFMSEANRLYGLLDFVFMIVGLLVVPVGLYQNVRASQMKARLVEELRLLSETKT
jgi:hypothetical protein